MRSLLQRFKFGLLGSAGSGFVGKQNIMVGVCGRAQVSLWYPACGEREDEVQGWAMPVPIQTFSQQPASQGPSFDEASILSVQSPFSSVILWGSSLLKNISHPDQGVVVHICVTLPGRRDADAWSSVLDVAVESIWGCNEYLNQWLSSKVDCSAGLCPTSWRSE